MAHEMTLTARGSQDITLWIASAALPAAAVAAFVFVHVEPGQWLAMRADMWRGVAADALLYTAGAVTLAAPLAGVAVANSQRRKHPRAARRTTAFRIAWRLAAATALLVASSALLTLALGGSAGALQLVGMSHATIGAVALALAAFGALCGLTFTDPLDAAACGMGAVLTAAGGLFVAGGWAAGLPRPVIDAAIIASPFATMASAARIDVSRMSVPYQISPLAHMQVSYPSWSAACGWYLAVAAFCLAALVRGRRTRTATTAFRH